MKKKNILCIALLGALGAAPAAFAQDFDDRWYVSANTGIVDYDSDRGLGSDIYGSIGLGKFFSPNWSIELDLNYSNPQQSAAGSELLWSQAGIGITPRYHFVRGERNWGPYVGLGIGATRSWEEFSNPNGGMPLERKDTNAYLQPNVGLQASYGRVGGRVEVAYRHSFDNSSMARPNNDDFGDLIYTVGLTVALGPEPATPVTPEPVAPPPPPPQRPAPPPQQEVPLTIDLRGVNFDFDRSELRPDAVRNLNETIEILRRYPDLRVEVAGHTDSVGSEQYNQGLSERRARAVYDYLTQNGISSNRLVGPVGHGELRPIDTNDTAEGRARNRRTELNVQN